MESRVTLPAPPTGHKQHAIHERIPLGLISTLGDTRSAPCLRGHVTTAHSGDGKIGPWNPSDESRAHLSRDLSHWSGEGQLEGHPHAKEYGEAQESASIEERTPSAWSTHHRHPG